MQDGKMDRCLVFGMGMSIVGSSLFFLRFFCMH